jgi:dolichyl-phosphate beta-glucosyltransferase
MKKACIVVPCYNEGSRLNISAFLAFLETSPHSVCFVNDGSSDNTLQVINSIKSNYPEKVKITELSENSGKAEAVRQGFLAIMISGEYEFIGYFDADLATPLQEVDFLLSNFTKELQVVIGSRVKRLGSEIERYPIRHYLGRVFATMASLTLDLEVYDSQCGAKFFRNGTAKTLFAKPFESRWFFDLEILYRLKNRNPEDFNNIILEVPLRAWHEKGNSRIKPIDVFKAPMELLKIKRRTL